MSEFEPYSPLTEPVTRPDGYTIQLKNGYYDNQVVVAGVGAWYSRREVIEIGLGDFVIGLAKIGQAYYECPEQQLLPGQTRLFNKF